MTVENDSIPIKIAFLDSTVIHYKDSTITSYKINYKDSIIFKTVVNFPKSKVEVRQEEKTKRKAIDVAGEVKVAKEKTKRVEVRKAAKIEVKTIKSQSSWWKFWLGFILGLIVYFLIINLANKIQKLL